MESTPRPGDQLALGHDESKGICNLSLEGRPSVRPVGPLFTIPLSMFTEAGTLVGPRGDGTDLFS